MFRKIVHIILSLFLLVANTGVCFSMHYCGGKIVCVSINPEHKSCCAEGEVNCCKIITEKIQLAEIYLIPQSDNLFQDISRNLQFENQKLFKDAFYFTFIAHTQKYYNYKFPPPPKIKAKLASLQSYLL